MLLLSKVTNLWISSSRASAPEEDPVWLAVPPHWSRNSQPEAENVGQNEEEQRASCSSEEKQPITQGPPEQDTTSQFKVKWYLWANHRGPPPEQDTREEETSFLQRVSCFQNFLPFWSTVSASGCLSLLTGAGWPLWGGLGVEQRF